MIYLYIACINFPRTQLRSQKNQLYKNKIKKRPIVIDESLKRGVTNKSSKVSHAATTSCYEGGWQARNTRANHPDSLWFPSHVVKMVPECTGSRNPVRGRGKSEREEKKKKKGETGERRVGEPPHNSCSTRAGPDAHARYSHGFLALWRPRTAIGPVLPSPPSFSPSLFFFPLGYTLLFPNTRFLRVCGPRGTACVGTHMSRIPTVPSPPSPCGRAPAKRRRMRPVTRAPLHPLQPLLVDVGRGGRGAKDGHVHSRARASSPFAALFRNGEGARVSKQPPCSARALKDCKCFFFFFFFLRLSDTCARWYVHVGSYTRDGMSVRCDGIRS